MALDMTDVNEKRTFCADMMERDGAGPHPGTRVTAPAPPGVPSLRVGAPAAGTPALAFHEEIA